MSAHDPLRSHSPEACRSLLCDKLDRTGYESRFSGFVRGEASITLWHTLELRGMCVLCNWQQRERHKRSAWAKDVCQHGCIVCLYVCHRDGGQCYLCMGIECKTCNASALCLFAEEYNHVTSQTQCKQPLWILAFICAPHLSFLCKGHWGLDSSILCSQSNTKGSFCTELRNRPLNAV